VNIGEEAGVVEGDPPAKFSGFSACVLLLEPATDEGSSVTEETAELDGEGSAKSMPRPMLSAAAAILKGGFASLAFLLRSFAEGNESEASPARLVDASFCLSTSRSSLGFQPEVIMLVLLIATAVNGGAGAGVPGDLGVKGPISGSVSLV
jgi:hypothetical protein